MTKKKYVKEPKPKHNPMETTERSEKDPFPSNQPPYQPPSVGHQGNIDMENALHEQRKKEKL